MPSPMVMISGVLFREPEEKTSKSGNPFARVTVSVTDGNERSFWSVVAFTDDNRDALLSLHVGAAIAVTGLLRASIYEPPNGEPRINWNVIASAIMPMAVASKKPKQHGRQQERAPKKRGLDRYSGGFAGHDELNDPIGF